MKKNKDFVSRSFFNNFLKNRETEDLNLIENLDKLFLKKRGYVIEKPKESSNVILLLSGGLDSIVAWAFLMEVRKYTVYPVFVKSKKFNLFSPEFRSIRYFSKYFSKKYGKKYVKPFYLTVSTQPKEKSMFIGKENLSGVDILNNFQLNNHFLENGSNIVIFEPQNVDPYIKSFYGLIYAQYLNFRHGLDVKDIFVGINASDGLLASSQSLTSIRSTMLSMCISTNKYDWSFSSPFFERELGSIMDKSSVIRIGHGLGLPLEKTWSCYKKNNILQCGNDCISCVNRRHSFEEAKVKDETFYSFSIKKRLFVALNFRLKKLLKLLSI